MSFLSATASRSWHHPRYRPCRRGCTSGSISSFSSFPFAIIDVSNEVQISKNPILVLRQQEKRKQRYYVHNPCRGGSAFVHNGIIGNMNKSMQYSSVEGTSYSASNSTNSVFKTFASTSIRTGSRSNNFSRRYLATKKKKNSNSSTNSKKRKLVLPNSNADNDVNDAIVNNNNNAINDTISNASGTYSTPGSSGLILPNKELIIDNQTNTTKQNVELLQDDNNDIFSPLLDQSLTNASSLSSSSSSTPSSLLGAGMSLNNIVDHTTMYNPAIHLPNKPNFNDPSKNYEPSTPLGEELFKYIAVAGAPITVAEYMARCLRDESFGYYTNPPKNTDEDFDADDIDDDDDQSAQKEEREEGGRGHRLIGQAGDFTTAPEISQIFGECLTIWLLTQYEALKKPSRVQLVELGPGRGTLMCDILRSASGIKGLGEDFIRALSGSGSDEKGDEEKMRNQVHGVHFVEVSESLRLTQRDALKSLLGQGKKVGSTISSSDGAGINLDFKQWETKKQKQRRLDSIMNKIREEQSLGKDVDDDLLKQIISEQDKNLRGRTGGYDKDGTNDSIPVHWHDTFDAVPFQTSSTSQSSEAVPTFIICQEFFDALPVHVFQKTDHGWRERLVDVAIDDEDEDEFDEYGQGEHSSNGKNVDGRNDRVQVQMIDGTTASVLAPTSKSSPLKESETGETNDEQKKRSRFRFVLSPDVTPATKTLLRIDDSSTTTLQAELDAAPSGTVMEVSPEGLSLIQDIALRIDECQGGALIIDYGNEGSRDTLRAFQKHEQVDVLSSPGKVDITADVDFSAMKNAVNKDMKELRETFENSINQGPVRERASRAGTPEAFGPQSQGQFLASMGAVERTIRLIEDDSTSDEQAEDLCTALERLVSSEEMGERFKVLAIARKKDGIFPPPGF